MKGTSIILNLLLICLTVVIPRIPPGDESYGDPILQILYILILLPVMAALLNLILAKAKQNRWPHITTCIVCLSGSVAAYAKWVVNTDHRFLQTGNELTFACFSLASVVVATLLFGALHFTGSGRTASRAEKD